MNIKEIYEKDWLISKDLKINKINLTGLESVEQECHINILRTGYVNAGKQEIHIDCGYQTYITKLSKSKLFTVTEVLVSRHTQKVGFVLAVKGILGNKGISLRKNARILTKEQKKVLEVRLKLLNEKSCISS